MPDQRTQRNLRVDNFAGLDVNTPPVLLENEHFQLDINGNRRRQMAWRPRRGYNRLLDGLSAGIKFTAAPRVVFTFERDDDTRFLVIAGKHTSFVAGLSDEVEGHTIGAVES
jgi:hypothetical protein